LAPETIDNQLTLLVAVQPQPDPVVRFTDPVAPPAAASNVAVASAMAQPVPCVTVNVCPSTVIAALRDGPVLRAAVNRTTPSPVPVAPEEIVSHAIVDVAVQPQPAPVRTLNDPWPPSSSMAAEDEESVNVQPSPWFSVNVCPAMVRVPLRAGPLVAAAAY
jgi:hypothetical protein